MDKRSATTYIFLYEILKLSDFRISRFSGMISQFQINFYISFWELVVSWFLFLLWFLDREQGTNSTPLMGGGIANQLKVGGQGACLRHTLYFWSISWLILCDFYWFLLISCDFAWFLEISVDFHWFLGKVYEVADPLVLEHAKTNHKWKRCIKVCLDSFSFDRKATPN